MISAKQYLQKLFGDKIFIEEFFSYSDLPMYLNENYNLCRLDLHMDFSYVLVKPKEEIKINIPTIKKQFLQIEKFTHLKPILVIDNLRLSQRNSLIQSNIAFIVPDRHIYIPQYIINLTEQETQINQYGETFSIATQVIYIYFLLKKIVETNAHQLSEELPYSVAAINRALRELCYRELLETFGNSTRKVYRIKDVKDYWKKGKKFLFNPVKARCYVDFNFDHTSFQMSNDLALSRLSFLNGRNVCYYAASTKEYNAIDKKYILNEYDVFEHDYCIIEKFSYDPKVLSKSQYIDVISLYAQFKDVKDERVQIEIESLVKELL